MPLSSFFTGMKIYRRKVFMKENKFVLKVVLSVIMSCMCVAVCI